MIIILLMIFMFQRCTCVSMELNVNMCIVLLNNDNLIIMNGVVDRATTYYEREKEICKKYSRVLSLKFKKGILFRFACITFALKTIYIRACHILMFSQKFNHRSGNLRFICIETRKKVS